MSRDREKKRVYVIIHTKQTQIRTNHTKVSCSIKASRFILLPKMSSNRKKTRLRYYDKYIYFQKYLFIFKVSCCIKASRFILLPKMSSNRKKTRLRYYDKYIYFQKYLFIFKVSCCIKASRFILLPKMSQLRQKKKCVYYYHSDKRNTLKRPKHSVCPKYFLFSKFCVVDLPVAFFAPQNELDRVRTRMSYHSDKRNTQNKDNKQCLLKVSFILKVLCYMNASRF